MLTPEKGIYVDSVQTDVIPVQDAKANGCNTVVTDNGCGDGVFGDGGIHSGNNFPVYPACGPFEGKQGIQPFPANIFVQFDMGIRLHRKPFQIQYFDLCGMCRLISPFL